MTFETSADAEKAREKLHGTLVEGRKIEVNVLPSDVFIYSFLFFFLFLISVLRQFLSAAMAPLLVHWFLISPLPPSPFTH